jgi:hypothetical protein
MHNPITLWKYRKYWKYRKLYRQRHTIMAAFTGVLAAGLGLVAWRHWSSRQAV